MFLEISLVAIASIILIYLSFYFAGIILSPVSQPVAFGQVCINENCFEVEIAKTPAQREKGLMNVKELDKNKGMFFVFEKDGIYPFWMKNTLIPLDMIWIDSNSKVVFISQNVQPCKSLICPNINPLVKAKYVLEINAGLCKEINLRIGDELKLSI